MPALLYSKRKIRKNMVVTENDINEGNIIPVRSKDLKF